MSNPTVNRLGVSQFWHRHWYSDSRYSHNLYQDKVFKDLILFYLKSGLTFQFNPFVKGYWHGRNFKNNNTRGNLVKFFRRFFYSNEFLGIEHSYLVRNLSAELFPMRLWILKYSGWLIFSVQAFKPMKGSSSKTLNFSGVPSSSNSIMLFSKVKLKSKRTKLIFSFLKSHIFQNSNNYFF